MNTSGNSNGSIAVAAAFGAPKSMTGRRVRGTLNNKLVYPCRVEGWLNIYGKWFRPKRIFAGDRQSSLFVDLFMDDSRG